MTKLLCIDDNPLSIYNIRQGLRSRPQITVLSALRGGAGTELARDQSPDVILLDPSLPDMSGEEVIARLKANPATRSVPVVLLAADGSRTLNPHSIAGGGGLQLTKPLDMNELLRTIDELSASPSTLRDAA
jgi:CheY-like chemotaxis protein